MIRSCRMRSWRLAGTIIVPRAVGWRRLTTSDTCRVKNKVFDGALTAPTARTRVTRGTGTMVSRRVRGAIFPVYDACFRVLALQELLLPDA